MTNRLLGYFREDSKIPGKGSLFASLAVNIILLYVVNNLRYMGIGQLTESKLISCMWSANIIFGIGIIGNFILIIYRPAGFYYLIQTLINAAGVNAFFFIYRIYPFDLNNTTLDHIIRIILILIMIGFFAAFLIEFYRLGTNVHFPKKKPPVSPEGLPPDSTAPPESPAAQDSAANPSPAGDAASPDQPSIAGPPHEPVTKADI